MGKRQREDYVIQSVIHALEVIEAIAEAREGEVGITQLSRILGLHKNNVFRLLASMGLRGYVWQNPKNGNYSLGPAVLRIANAYLNNNLLMRQVLEIVEELSKESGETVSLGVLNNGDITFPISIASERALFAKTRTADRIRWYECLTGKFLIAKSSQKIRENLFLELSGELKDTIICELNTLCEKDTIINKDSEEGLMYAIAICKLGMNFIKEEDETAFGAIELRAPINRADETALLDILKKGKAKLEDKLVNRWVKLADRIVKEVEREDSVEDTGVRVNSDEQGASIERTKHHR